VSPKTKNRVVRKPIPPILARAKIQLLPEINEGDEKLETEPNSCSCINERNGTGTITKMDKEGK
jgi:uncharacterized ParB-like nuclease family protein